MSKGFNYYKADTDRFQDIKIKRLKKQFGPEGYCVYQYALNEIYRVDGCFLQWTADHVFDCAEYWGITEDRVNEIIKYCTEVRLFDSIAFKSCILTARSMQSRYIDMCRVSKKKAYIPLEILLIEPEAEKIPHKEKIIPFQNSANTLESSANTLEQSANIQEVSSNIPEKTHKEKKRKEKEIPPHTPQQIQEEARRLISALENNNSVYETQQQPATQRNTQFLLETLNRYNFMPAEVEEVLLLTNYGEIGHPIWKLLQDVAASTKIKYPRQYMLSRLRGTTTKSAAS